MGISLERNQSRSGRVVLGLLAVALLGLLAVQGCTSPAGELPPEPEVVGVAEGSYWNISAVRLDSMLQQKDFLFINVHIPYEGEIAGTDSFIPFDEMEQNLSKLPSDKGTRIVVYCRSGSMSAISAEVLVGLSYTNVWNLKGGMVEWQGEGYSLINNPK